MDATCAPGRLRGRAAFGALRQGRRVRRGTVTVTWAEGDPAQPPRVAYAVGRRAGGAVVRNRVRRRLRAIIRELAVDAGENTGMHTGEHTGERMAPGAYLVGAGPDAATLPYNELKAMMTEALRAVTTSHATRAERRP